MLLDLNMHLKLISTTAFYLSLYPNLTSKILRNSTVLNCFENTKKNLGVIFVARKNTFTLFSYLFKTEEKWEKQTSI